MKNQQLAEKEEQQKIKNLVLNYDLQQSEDQESTLAPVLVKALPMLTRYLGQERQSTFHHNRSDKFGKDRSQRTRKLQLSDVDW